MIIVANQPVQLSPSEWSAFAWQWLQQLQNRPERYVYQSMEHLHFEWDLRESRGCSQRTGSKRSKLCII